jgi:hypothetical protein
MVADADMTRGQHGIADLERLAGCPLSDIATAIARTTTGGAHVVYATGGRRYRNVRIPGTAIDVKCEGGYVVLPTPNNGRTWLKPLLGASLLPAPAWLDAALRTETTRPMAVSPRQLTDDPWVRQQALKALRRACERIVVAQPGERDNVRHRECYTVGGLIGRGDLDEAEAHQALLAASLEMQAKGHGWHDLEKRVAASLAAGIERPLPLSDIDRLMRSLHISAPLRKSSPALQRLRARMQAQRPRNE